MSLPLLQTKLYIPPVRRRLVSRPRLIEKLNQGQDYKLILVSAPAGYGKTTLLSAWLNQCPYPTTWLSLDDGDNDPARFLTYLVIALQKLNGEIGQTLLPMLQSPQLLPNNVLLLQLVNDLVQLPGHFWLVLEDYHVIQETMVHQAMNFLLEQLPWQMHLVISTRADPPLPLARLRARLQMLELRTSDLCFSTEETEKYLNQEMGLSISKDDIETMVARTEGWIAGLQMAAVSMEGREDTSHFIRNFAGSNRHVLDYLMEEVLERQPEAIQDFLLKTSILNDLNGSLCDAVTNQNDGQSMLEWLDRANLFIVPLDDRRFGYRYHHLFSDLLRQRLQKIYPEQLFALHLRASEWYEGNGLASDSIRHAFSACEFSRAARLIEQLADKSLMLGEIRTFLGWVEQVPEAVARQRPILCVYHVEALLLSGRPVDQVALRLEGTPEYAAVQVLTASNQGNVELSRQLSERVLEQLPKENTFLRGAITSILGVSFLLSGDVERAIQAFQSSAEIGRKNGYLFLEVIALCRLGQLHLLKAELNVAEDYYKKALERSSDGRGSHLPIASMPLSHLAYLVREWNDLPSALSYIQKAVELVQESGGFWSVDCFAIYAFLLQAQGESEMARDAIGKARQIASMTEANRFDDIYTAAYEAQIALAQGNLGVAVQWAKDNDLIYLEKPGKAKPEERYNPNLYHLVELEQTTLARIYLAQGKHDEALVILANLLSETERLGRRKTAIENRVLQALAFQSKGHIAEALDILETALEMTEPEGFIRVFIDEGYPMERLLMAAMTRGKSCEYTIKLLGELRDESTFKTAPTGAETLIEPLSKRELEVLGLIAEGLTNDEIARQLYISLSTVKGHTTNIFGKLNVKNRTQAVSRARSLGLLPSN